MFPTILRPGYITKKCFRKCWEKYVLIPAIMGSVKPGVVPKAPGMKYKHYAPDADLAIVEGDINKVVDKINALTKEKESLRIPCRYYGNTGNKKTAMKAVL